MKKNSFQILILFTLIFSFLFYPQNISARNKNKQAIKRIEKILSRPELSDAFTGIEIYNLNKKKIFFEKNAHKLFTPASSLKLLTTSAALFFMPDSYKFETKLRSNGVIVDSVLKGDLIFRGGGDPLFSYVELDSLIKNFASLGVKEVKGNLLGDVGWSDSLYFGKGWMWDDNPEPFVPYISPLTLESSKIRIIVKPSAPFTLAQVEVFPPVSSIQIKNNILTVADDTTYFTVTRNLKNNDNTIITDGFVALNSLPDTTYLNVYAPEKIFIDAAKKLLDEKNIKINGKTKIARNVPFVKEFYSYGRSLDSVIYKTNKESDNFCAEMTLRALGEYIFGKPATAKKGIAVIDSLITLIGKDPETYTIADGSGISRYNLISPELLVETFKFLHDNKPAAFTKLINTLPIMGVDGTLEDRHKKGVAFGNAKAKTGTMTAVSSLCGITENRSGDTLIFSIMMQNFSSSVADVRLYQDIITEIISKLR
jgi:D-alanyl-D-alanine carboxypeptidase/D-alanyl-D-alanine-endopeptidase (penicillin-binding protein 4)